MAKGFRDSSGKFRPTGNIGSSSRDKSTHAEGMKMSHGVCESFLENPPSHRGEDKEHDNQVMYSLGDENCASVLTDEEFSTLLTNDQVANTFQPIGETAEKWQNDEGFRAKIIDRAQELIEAKERKDTGLSQVALDMNAFVDRQGARDGLDVVEVTKYLKSRGHTDSEINNHYESMGLRV